MQAGRWIDNRPSPTTSDEDLEWRPSPTTSDEELEALEAAEEMEIEVLRARQLARREVLLGGAVVADAGGKRYVCEELDEHRDEQSLDVSLDAVRDTATS